MDGLATGHVQPPEASGLDDAIRRTGGRRRWRRNLARSRDFGSSKRRVEPAGELAPDANATTQKSSGAGEERTTSPRKSQPAKARKQAPLIHTDKMNASSPSLYVHAPKTASAAQVVRAEGASALPAPPKPPAALPDAAPARRAPLPSIFIHQLQVNSTSVTLSWLLVSAASTDEQAASLAHGTGRQRPEIRDERPLDRKPDAGGRQKQREHRAGDHESHSGGAAGGDWSAGRFKREAEWAADSRLENARRAKREKALGRAMDEDHKRTEDKRAKVDSDEGEQQQSRLGNSSSDLVEGLGGSLPPSGLASPNLGQREPPSKAHESQQLTSTEPPAGDLHQPSGDTHQQQPPSGPAETRRPGWRRRSATSKHPARDELALIRAASVPSNRLPMVLEATSGNHNRRAAKSLQATPNNNLLLDTSSEPILVNQTSSTLQAPAATASTKARTPTTSLEDTAAEWLVRLRRFGSDELDIVQIVARNLSGNSTEAHHSEPIVRQIAFKGLDPSTGYEICVEPSSSNENSQAIVDKYQILDANQFSTLKCQDPLTASNSSDSTVSTTSLQKSLCKEFFTLKLDSNDSLIFGAETSGGFKPKAIHALLNDSSTVLRRPKSLDNVIKSRMELLEVNDQLGGPRDLNLFEVHVSHPRFENRFNHEQVTTLATEQLPALRLGKSSAASNQDLLSLSVLPIVGCIFALIFIITLVNVILSAINCRSSSVKKGRRPRRNPDLGSFYSGSNNSGSSQSRMVVVGAKNSEPFAISSGYFEVPSAQPSSPASPNSNYLLARFPLGSSFDGDENHNADMVGLARKNYDDFIYNMYNSTHSATDLSAKCKSTASGSPSSFEHVSISCQRHLQRRDVPQRMPMNGVEYTQDNVSGEPPQSRSSAQSSNTSRSKQRVRYDKINPIYNMDQYSCPTRATMGGRPRRPLTVSTFGHSNRALVEDEQHSSDAMTTEDGQGNVSDFEGVEDCELCQKETSIATYIEEPFTCCLDKQKQRFEKQQQQLERVLTKNGSLVPQPFIHPIEPQCCQLANRQLASPGQGEEGEPGASSVNKPDEGDQEMPGAQGGGEREEAVVRGLSQPHMIEDGSTYPPMPPPPPPLPAESPPPDVAPDDLAMKRKDFNQRRSELASKLHLNGMTRAGA